MSPIKDQKKLVRAIIAALTKDKKKAVKALNDLTKEDPLQDPAHVSDNAASDTDAFEQSSHERIESLQRELTERIATIDHALSRIGEGTYGICEECGVQIPSDRLTIMPTATVCVSCEQKKEQG